MPAEIQLENMSNYSYTHKKYARSNLSNITARISSGQSPVQFKDAIDTAHAQIGNRALTHYISQHYRQQVHDIAQDSFREGGHAYPFQEQIQQAFGGRHDISDLQAYTGTAAQAANANLGSRAFCKGRYVAFAGQPTLKEAAHEATHGVQQAALEDSLHLKRGIGEVGDKYERHADAVAKAVVRGESVESLLDRVAGGPTEVTPTPAKENAPVQMMGGGLFRGIQEAMNHGVRIRLPPHLFQVVRRALSRLPDFVFSRDSFPDYFRVKAGVSPLSVLEPVYSQELIGLTSGKEAYYQPGHPQTCEHALIDEMTDSFKGKAISWRELSNQKRRKISPDEIAGILPDACGFWPDIVRTITDSIVRSNIAGDSRRIRFNMSHLDMSIFHNLPLFTSPREDFKLNTSEEWIEFHKRFGFTFWELFWVLTNPEVIPYTQFYNRHSAQPWLKGDWGNLYNPDLDDEKVEYKPMTEKQKTDMGIVPFEYSDKRMRWVNPLDIDYSRNMLSIANRFNTYPHEWNYPFSAAGTAEGRPRPGWEFRKRR